MYTTAFKDYYSLLDIPFGADEAAIKAAYRRKAREQHPDMHPDETEQYTQLFQELTQAYETLSDPYKKATYDAGYRQTVLGEVSAEYYVETYYAAETPEDTSVYEHKYTSRSKKSFPFVKVGMFLVLVFQVVRLLLQTAPVAPEPKPAVTGPGNIQEVLQRIRERDAGKDMPYSTPAQRP